VLTRRHFAAAAAALIGSGLGTAARARRLDQNALLAFEPLGQVTLLHFADCHAQLRPIHFREPSINLGVGESAGLPPHLVGRELLQRFAVAPGSAEAFALTFDDFATLARNYGRLGGMDRMATAVAAIRAERPSRVLLLDGGDTWQGSYTSLASKGADMVEVQKALGVDAMTAHWEFTHGQDRVKELASSAGFPLLAGNVKDATWNEDVFDGAATFERGGVKIAVIGQAFPYTPIANPRHMMADWSFGIEEERLAKRVADARAGGADLIVLLSHNGFDVDRKLARRVKGIDVILTGHTHDALPAAIEVEGTLLIASGSHGKFLSRLDLDVRGKRVAGYRYRLIPLFADAIRPDPAMAALIERIRAPHAAMLARELGRTEGLLYRRGNFNGTFDDLICQAMLAERDAEIALSPGFRWGNSLLPGEAITVEDVYNLTAITYPACYRTAMTGAFLKDILEDVADNLFHPDPYYQQGGDMVRVGGLSFTIDPKAGIGRRISAMTLLRTGEAIDAARSYTVAGWASVNEATEGPPIWDVVMRHVARVRTVNVPETRHVRVLGL
jgi:sulfur-oxidizing protein SoxB